MPQQYYDFVRHFGGRFFVRIHDTGRLGIDGSAAFEKRFRILEEGPGGVGGAEPLPYGIEPGAKPDAFRPGEERLPRSRDGQGTAAQGEHRRGVTGSVQHGEERLQLQLPESRFPALPENLRDGPPTAGDDFRIQVYETGPQAPCKRLPRAAFAAAHETCQRNRHLFAKIAWQRYAQFAKKSLSCQTKFYALCH